MSWNLGPPADPDRLRRLAPSTNQLWRGNLP